MDGRSADEFSRRGQGLVWGLILALYFIVRLAMRIAAPAPPFVRVQPLSGCTGTCCVEVWLAGKPGDRLTRLTDYGKHGERWTTGAALVRATGVSPELPTTVKTSAGTCQIRRYHLLVGNQEADSLALE